MAWTETNMSSIPAPVRAKNQQYQDAMKGVWDRLKPSVDTACVGSNCDVARYVRLINVEYGHPSQFESAIIGRYFSARARAELAASESRGSRPRAATQARSRGAQNVNFEARTGLDRDNQPGPAGQLGIGLAGALLTYLGGRFFWNRRKRQFERTNRYGVEEYNSFGSMVKSDMYDSFGSWLALPALLIGLLMVVGGFGTFILESIEKLAG